MRVETLGEGTPTVAAVGAIHGDEPCGARAIERFLGAERAIERPVKLILANERALERDVRFVERDLNRSFPGDPDSEVGEERLAHALVREVENCLTLGFHSTVSTEKAFGTVADLDARKRAVFRALPVDAVADFTDVVEGRSVNLPGFLNVEAGYQGSAAAAENAYDCLLAFLRATGVLADDRDPRTEANAPATETTVYEVTEAIAKEPGSSYEVLKPNFERVAPGEVFAEVDGEPLRADRAFWPVLMSTAGHATLLGYEAQEAGPIGDATEPT
jgi:succinylglutamate desuccinylase